MRDLLFQGNEDIIHYTMASLTGRHLFRSDELVTTGGRWSATGQSVLLNSTHGDVVRGRGEECTMMSHIPPMLLFKVAQHVPSHVLAFVSSVRSFVDVLWVIDVIYYSDFFTNT